MTHDLVTDMLGSANPEIAQGREIPVKEVLDHVREFGHDSETLNVIYVVDERGKLIDDLRIRERGHVAGFDGGHRFAK